MIQAYLEENLDLGWHVVFEGRCYRVVSKEHYGGVGEDWERICQKDQIPLGGWKYCLEAVE